MRSEVIVKILETEKMFSVNFSSIVEEEIVKKIVGYLSKGYRKKVLLVKSIRLCPEIKDGKVIGYIETRRGKGVKRIVKPEYSKYYTNKNIIVTNYCYDILTLGELLDEVEKMKKSPKKYKNRYEFIEEIEEEENELVST